MAARPVERYSVYLADLDSTRGREIAVDQIRTISKERPGRRLDALEPATAMLLRRLISEMYGE